jgi:hypothetical protein
VKYLTCTRGSAQISEFSSNGKIRELDPWCGGPTAQPSPLCTGGRRGQLALGCFVGARHANAAGLWGSPVKDREEEGDEAKP